MTNKALSIFNQLRPLSVGFDDMFDHFESMFDVPTVNYPPYNLVKTGDNKFNIEIALAGFNKKDINITSENGMLTIESKQDEKSKDTKDGEVIHKGISQRYFKRSFTIADDVEIKGCRVKRRLIESVYGEDYSRRKKTKDYYN